MVKLSNREKLMFKDLNFIDIFNSFDEEYLKDMAMNNPKQLEKMCLFLCLDTQILKEQMESSSKKFNS